MFSCKVCAEKEKRVSDLLSEIDFLRNLVRPSAPTDYTKLPTVSLEADAIISVADHQIENLSPEERLRQEEIASEASRVLNGTY